MKLMTHSQGLKGTLVVPGDKSISHRSVMFGALAKGKTVIRHFLQAEDCLHTIAAFRQLGVTIENQSDQVIVYGKGMNGLTPSQQPIQVGNSGTTMRLLAGILAGQPFSTTLIGDASLNKRPMNRILQPLTQMGAHCFGHQQSEFPPITIVGTRALQPIDYALPIASAQVKSALLFAALQAKGTSTIIEKAPTRNHTEEMIEQFGGTMAIDGKKLTVQGPQSLIGRTLTVPGDLSSAAFFIVASLLVPHSKLCLQQVGLNQSRTGILDVIQRMGGQVLIEKMDQQMGNIYVQTSELTSTVIQGDEIPRLIDELPLIALLATQAKGTTLIKDAQELKVKESNRIQAVADTLNTLGAAVTPTEDGFKIQGPTPLQAGEVSSFGDHRIGMMAQVAALLVKEGSVTLDQADVVSVSYPQFFADLARLSEP